MSTLKTTIWDASEHLTSPDAIAEYMTAVLEDGDPDLLLAALGDIAKAKGMTELSRKTGLGRESLYKALSAGAKPRYDTILKVMRGLDIHLTASI